MNLFFKEKKREAGDVFTFIFEPSRPMTWKAGQFLFYTLPHNNPDDRGVTRYFTISSAPNEKYIFLTTRLFEKSSTFKANLMKLKPGDSIEASDPDGDFTMDDTEGNYIFIAGGIGITPYRSILLDMDFKNYPINVNLLYANHDEDFVFKKELEELSTKHEGFKINYFISPRHIQWPDIQEAVNGQLSIVKRQPIIYVSGPETMVEGFEKMLKENGLSEKEIKLDFFPGYDPIK